MLNKKQDQAVAEGGAALQAGGDMNVINTGLTVLEARAIAFDVAKATFYELTGVARDTASSRVEEITNRVIEKLEKEYPAGLQKAQDPGFQYPSWRYGSTEVYRLQNGVQKRGQIHSRTKKRAGCPLTPVSVLSRKVSGKFSPYA